ncbi:hypothetical protein SH1V18_32280 [Vallitalea longa]|uniref:Uncharacterized protein n=1 Tax=Vallitalea longa TaxID=2936439 RepID=A0A9W5YGG6_9FIRM|nr:hypothetical protein [Vallitalea longa]GKX30748.1 hypothetical protein SH1V18_32280 [Vallitalea longa]
MSNKSKLIIMVLLTICLITSCNTTAKERDINDEGEVTSAEIETFEETESDNLDGRITIAEDKMNELTCSGIKYNIKSFRAQFTLINNNEEAVDLKIRIPFTEKNVPKNESIFIFLDKTNSEAVFHLEPKEKKEITIDRDNYNIKGNIGSINGIASIGVVGELVINTGDRWNYINYNEPGKVEPWDIETDIGLLKKFTSYEKRIHELEKENEELEREAKNFESAYNVLKGNNKEFKESLPDYRVIKYSEESGIRKYTGKVPLRIYPSLDAPALNLETKDILVNCIYSVLVDDITWGMVLVNNYGDAKVGFAPIEDFVKVEDSDNAISTVESLGGFRTGDRIEKLIGTLDRDYTVISENICIYSFPDDNYVETDAMNRPFGNKTLDTFVDNDFRVSTIRTNSPQFQLECGFKVGDRAKEVFEYFGEKYESDEDAYMYGDYNYRLSDTEVISFYINTQELEEDSLITSIWIQ